MRPLNADEAALWARLIATIAPIRRDPAPVLRDKPAAPMTAKAAASAPQPKPVKSAPTPSNLITLVPARATPVATLDGGWDRRLSRGIVEPSMTVDLHGYTLSSAHAVLDAALERAVRDEDRVILLVTGKDRRDGSGRGAIARAVRDWLAVSRFAARIAAVRGAHPRHGGSGALYIVMRRTRG